VSQRPEGDHVWELPTVDFHRWFCLNFASTVHKAQGDTLEGPITIWDSEAMDARILYTAITRAKKLGQISFS
jgi:ATP-dependent exoDNAse (exonuclease V) alpha subunit